MLGLVCVCCHVMVSFVASIFFAISGLVLLSLQTSGFIFSLVSDKAGPYHSYITYVSNFDFPNTYVHWRTYLKPVVPGSLEDRRLVGWMNITKDFGPVSVRLNVETESDGDYKRFALDNLRSGNICKDKNYAMFLKNYKPAFWDDPEGCIWKAGYTEITEGILLDDCLHRDVNLNSTMYEKFRVNLTMFHGTVPVMGYSMLLTFESLATHEHKLNLKKKLLEKKSKIRHRPTRPTIIARNPE